MAKTILQFPDINGYHFTTTDVSENTLSEKIKTMAKNYVEDKHKPIQHVAQLYQQSSDKYLFGFFSVKLFNSDINNDKDERWICLSINRKYEKLISVEAVKRRILSELDNEKSCQEDILQMVDKLLKTYFNEESFDVHLAQTKLFSNALIKISKNVLEICFDPESSLNLKQKSNSDSFSLVQIFDQCVINYGLSAENNARFPKMFEKVLFSLESLIKAKPQFRIDRVLFSNLCRKLNNINLKPKKDDTIDLRIQTLKLIVKLKENGQLIDRLIVQNELETGFLLKESRIFIKQIKDFDYQFQDNPRNTKASGCLKLVINDRIEYLCNKNKLVPNLVTSHDIIELFRYFMLEKGIKILTKRRKQIENKTTNIEEEFQSMKQTKLTIKRCAKLKAIRYKLEYLQVKFNDRFDCNFQKLVPLLASKTCNELELSSNFIAKLFDIGIKFITEPLVSHIINILLALPKKQFYESEKLDIPIEFLKYLRKDTKHAFIKLVIRGFFHKKYPQLVNEFLISILIENEDETVRTYALKALNLTEPFLIGEFKAIVSIENKSSRLTKAEYIKEILHHVQKDHRLTWTCFECLKKDQLNEETVNLIQTVVKRDLQNLPEFLTQFLIDAICSILTKNVLGKEKWFKLFRNTDAVMTILKLCETLIVGKYMKMSQLSESLLLKILLNEKYRNNVLLIILTSTRMGETIPDSIITTINNITPRTALVMNCIRYFAKKESLIDVMMNSNKPAEERIVAIQKLKQDEALSDDYTIKIIMNLVKFDPNLKQYAFLLFLEIVSIKTWPGCETSFPDMIQSMKIRDSIVPIQAISNFVNKSFLSDNKSVIDYLIYRMFTGNLDIQRECTTTLTHIFEKNISKDNIWTKIMPIHNRTFSRPLLSPSNPFTEILIKHFIALIRFSPFEEIKISLLNLLDKHFDLDSLSHSQKRIINAARIILFNKIDTNILSQLFETVQRGFFVPEKIIHNIIESLNVQSLLPKQTVESNVLLLIHSKQKLKLETFKQLLLAIEKNLQLVENIQIMTMLLEGLKMDMVLERFSLELLNKFLYLLNDEKAENQLRLFVLEMIRLNFSKFSWIPDQDTTHPIMIKTLQDFCMERKTLNKGLVVVQKKLALETLLSINHSIEEVDIPKYYEQIKIFLIQPASENCLKELDSFMLNSSKKNRIRVLYDLTITAMCNQRVNSQIFVCKNESQWQKEILCDVLVKLILQQSTEINEFALDDFLNNLGRFENRTKKFDSKYQVETLLEYLIDNKCAKSFEYLSEILYLLKDSDSLSILFAKDMHFDEKISKLRLKLIGKRLSSFSFTELKTLTKETQKYQIHTVDKLIKRSLDFDSPESLIKFFKRLSFHVSTKRQECFLKEICCMRSVQDWNKALSKEIIEDLLEKVVKKELVELERSGKQVEIVLLKQKLRCIFESGWTLQSIKTIIERIFSNFENFFEFDSMSLDIIYEYNLKEYDLDIEGTSVMEIIDKRSVKKWGKALHKIAVFKTFFRTYEKPLSQLIEEIAILNSKQDINYLKDRQTLEEDYKQVKKSYKSISKLQLNESKPISKWEDSEIKMWASKAKTYFKTLAGNEFQKFLCESIAVTMQAVNIVHKIELRNIQILSLLCMLHPTKNRGRLAQINTGEGKTTIIAILGVIKALQGHSIDIITSSPELAKPQSIQQEPFFSLFGISVSHNGEDLKDIKERYKSIIVYGAADRFQGDILRDEYSKLGVRSGRNCDLAIVDEVDSMLIDGKNHIVMLSSFMPAMNYLEPILAALYVQICLVSRHIIEKNGKCYVIDKQKQIGDDGNVLEDINDNNIEIQINMSKAEFINIETEIHIRKVLRDKEGLKVFSEVQQNIPKDYAQIHIPKHLYEFVTKTQLKKWIDSAIYAIFICEKDKHYILTEDGKIAPVDDKNTGVIQQNMHWNNGLQQFLQIKHGAKIIPENLTTNFISNVSFFQRYGSNIYGLTGTLGSSNSINLLNKTYFADSVIIPPFRQKQHQELRPIIVSNEEEWYENIIESTLQKLRHGRGVLIISRYIKQVDEINKRLLNKYDSKNIKVYKSQRDSDSVHAELKIGEVIIATNIAGRGTDIKPSPKMEENGGLHVCLTFLPDNQRIEEQNIGRTSRTGNKGTSQFILLETHGRSLHKLKMIRNLNETESLKSAETEIQRVTSKDAIFQDFCRFLENIDDDQDKRSVEERFGIWLQMYDDRFNTESKNSLLKLFETTFKMKITEDKNSNNLTQNICFHIKKSNALIKSENIEEAIVECGAAIKKDFNFSEMAYYNRAYCLLAKYGGDSILKKKDTNHIKDAQKDLCEARKLINKRLLELQIIQNASSGGNLSEQVRNKMILYNVQLNTIRQAIGIDCYETNKELIQLHKNRKKIEGKKEKSSDMLRDLENIIVKIGEIEKGLKNDSGGVIGKALKENFDIRIIFLELNLTLPDDQDIQYFTEEIDEFRHNGMIGNFQISELQPIPWTQLSFMAFIGLVQITTGALLDVFTLGLGSLIGNALIFDGISDIFYAIQNGIVNRNINWKSWSIQKGISFTTALCLSGLSGIVDVLKTSQAGLKKLTQSFITEFSENGFQLALKNISLKIAKGISKEMASYLINETVDKTILSEIEDLLISRFQPTIYEALDSNPNVKRLLAIDVYNRNNVFQNIILKEALKILCQNKEKNGLDVTSLGMTFASLFSDARAKGLKKPLEFVKNIITTGETMLKLLTFEQKFLMNLDDSISKIVKNKNNEIKKIEVDMTARDAPNIDISDQQNNNDIDLSKLKQPEEQVQVQQGIVSTRKVCTVISEKFASSMTNIIKNKIVMPITQSAVNISLEKAFANFEQKFHQETKVYKEDRVANFILSGDVENRVPFEIKEARAKDFEYMENARSKAKQDIDKLRNGGEAGVLEMYALSEGINKKIIVYNKNGKISKVINDHLAGDPVKLEYHPAQNDTPPHWTLLGGKEPSIQSGKNNCLFNCVAVQTGQIPDNLRLKTVETMTQNINRYAIVMKEIEQVREYKSEWHMYGGNIKKRKINEIIEHFESEDFETKIVGDENCLEVDVSHIEKELNENDITIEVERLQNPNTTEKTVGSLELKEDANKNRRTRFEKDNSAVNINIVKEGEKITQVTAIGLHTKLSLKSKSETRLSRPNNPEANEYYEKVGISGKGVDAGHLIADTLRGPNSKYNYISMPQKLNRGKVNKLEQEMKQKIIDENVIIVTENIANFNHEYQTPKLDEYVVSGLIIDLEGHITEHTLHAYVPTSDEE